MPSFKQLKQDEKDALAAFMLGLQDNRNEPVADRENDPVPVPYSHTGYNRFLDQDGYPAVKPPWGTISAIDLNNGTLLWQIPLGEYKELTARGIPKTGTENYGGPVVTAGGLLFIGASKDEYFRAFDKDTGAELWKYKLPAGGYATPAVYEASGKQYVVIACGGGKMGTRSGDRYVAFALGKPR
jgi:quinoprotein glucose dehydrogenase